jgi:hypothetical protein
LQQKVHDACVIPRGCEMQWCGIPTVGIQVRVHPGVDISASGQETSDLVHVLMYDGTMQRLGVAVGERIREPPPRAAHGGNHDERDDPKQMAAAEAHETWYELAG